MAAGEKLYNGACIACHEDDGSGAPRIYPPLPGNANLQSADALSTLRIILDGAETVTTPRAPNKGSMPAYAAKMTDQQIADVTNYIRNAWGNAAPLVTADQVAKARREVVSRTLQPAWRGAAEPASRTMRPRSPRPSFETPLRGSSG